VVLETSVTRAGTRGGGINAPIAAYLEARTRLVRTADNVEIWAAHHVYMGGRRKLSEWSADGGEPLVRALADGYRTLGAHIHDNVFLLYSLPDQQPRWGGVLSVAFGLAPVYPRTRGTLSGDRIIGSHFEWTSVDELQPTLEWQRFPREADVAAAPEEMARVNDVRYDLIIAREHNLAPEEIVYRRDGLPDAVHRIEVPLAPATRYFWTVRARFQLDGRERVTQWGSTHHMAGETLAAPSELSYRFKTRQAPQIRQ
jgi:hypothetical protein